MSYQRLDQQCAFCLHLRPLERSHLFPQSVYKYIHHFTIAGTSTPSTFGENAESETSVARSSEVSSRHNALACPLKIHAADGNVSSRQSLISFQFRMFLTSLNSSNACLWTRGRPGCDCSHDSITCCTLLRQLLMPLLSYPTPSPTPSGAAEPSPPTKPTLTPFPHISETVQKLLD